MNAALQFELERASIFLANDARNGHFDHRLAAEKFQKHSHPLAGGHDPAHNGLQAVKSAAGNVHRLARFKLFVQDIHMIGAYGRSLETTAGLAARIGALAVYGLPLEEIGRYVQRVQDVTPAQVAAYASAHLTAKDSKVVVVGDAGKFATAVRATHPQAQLLQATALDLDSASLHKPHQSK